MLMPELVPYYFGAASDAAGSNEVPPAQFALRVVGGLINVIFWATVLYCCCAFRRRCCGSGAGDAAPAPLRAVPRPPQPAHGVPVALPVSCPLPAALGGGSNHEAGAPAVSGPVWSQPMAYLPESSFLRPKGSPWRSRRRSRQPSTRSSSDGRGGGGGGADRAQQPEHCVIGMPVDALPGPEQAEAAVAGPAAAALESQRDSGGGEWVEVALVSDEAVLSRQPEDEEQAQRRERV
jgi:hypothetical protein